MAEAESNAQTVAAAVNTPEIELAHFAPDTSDASKQERTLASATDTARVAEWPRWVYTATKTPLAAGSTGPLALLVSVSGLAGPFRQLIDSEGNRSNDGKPKWVVGMTAGALVLEITGNVALFLNFYGRVFSYRTAMAVSLTSFILNVCMLFSVIAAFMVLYPEDSPDSETYYAQGYWLTIAAAVLSFFTSTFLFVNYLGYRQEYYKSFTLSLGQRLLIMQNMMFLLWVALGALIFAVIEEGLTFVKALYFINVSLLTMKSTLGRAILIPYTFIGIALLGLVVAAIRNVVVEDARERLIKRHLANISRKKKFGIAAGLRSGASTSVMVGQLSDTELYGQFQEMRKRQKKLERSRAFMTTGITIGVFVMFWVGGAAIFATTESWTFFEGFYFAFVSLITIGYGDYTVGTDPGRAIFILWSLMAVPLMTILVSSVGDTFTNILQEQTRKQIGNNSEGSSGIPTNNGGAQLGYIRASGGGGLQPLRELPENEADLKQLAQNTLPEEIIRLSEKLLKYAEHVSSEANCKYSFTEYQEMANDTGTDYDYREVIMPQNEEMVFLRNYGMALERATEELRIASQRLAMG